MIITNVLLLRTHIKAYFISLGFCFTVDLFTTDLFTIDLFTVDLFTIDLFIIDLFTVDLFTVDLFTVDLFTVDLFTIDLFTIDLFNVDLFTIDLFTVDLFTIDLFTIDLFTITTTFCTYKHSLTSGALLYLTLISCVNHIDKTICQVFIEVGSSNKMNYCNFGYSKTNYSVPNSAVLLSII